MTTPPSADRSFEGMTRKEARTYQTYQLTPDEAAAKIVACPVCDGFGGWTMTKPPYGRLFCVQCVGWGWVDRDGPDHTCPEHVWETKTVGKCLHRWTCTLCGYSRLVDSSG